MFIRFDNPFDDSPKDMRKNIFKDHILCSDVTLNINQIKEIKVFQSTDTDGTPSPTWCVSMCYDNPNSPLYYPFVVFSFPDRNIIIHYYENLLAVLDDENNKNKIILHSSLFLDNKYGHSYYQDSVLDDIYNYSCKYDF